MDTTTAVRGILAGVAATGAMSLIEAPAWRHWGLPAVLDWEQNQAVAARLLRQPRELLVLPGLGLHFVHGALAGIVFALALPFLPLSLPVPALGVGYGLVLWLLTLLVHVPTTGHRPGEGPREQVALVVSLASHLVYGVLLAALVISV